MSEIKTALGNFSLQREKRPDHTALICGEKTRTWKEFDERANRAANALLELGAGKGDKVGIYCLFSRSIEFMEVFYGAMKLGAVPFYVNYRYTPKEIKFVLEDTDAGFLFLEDKLLPPVQEIKQGLGKIKSYVVIGEKENVPEGMVHYEGLLDKQPETPPGYDWDQPGPGDIAWLQHTTGTTGSPKGALLDHDSYVHSMAKILPPIFSLLALKYDKVPETANVKKEARHPARTAQLLSYKSMEVDTLIDIFGSRTFLCIPPLVTAAGTDHAMTWLTAGASVAFPVEFSAAHICETIEKRKVTDMLIAGDAIALPLLEELKKGGYDTASLTWIYSTGVKLSKNVKKALLELVPSAVIFDALSTTEAWYLLGGITCPGEEPEEAFIPVNQTTVAVLNDEGDLVEEGEIGEIVTAKKATEGYYKYPEKSAQTFRKMRMPFQDEAGIWVFTGDYGTYDEKGRVVLKGRGAEVIDTGGLKVFTPEVSGLIANHPKVQDVVVIATPHERWGNAVTALVQPKENETITEQEIVDFCKKDLADFKIPKRVAFAEIPRDPMGKVPIKEAIKVAKKKLGIEE